MARVATPGQAEAAKQAVSQMTDIRTGAGGAANRFGRTRPLQRFERNALKAPVEAVFLYNISPIFMWQKIYPGLGALTLRAREEKEPYSAPVVLERRMVRPFDGGNNIQQLMVEEPLDIAQDFLVCSPEFPGRPENNLTRYGCFYTLGEPIENQDDRQKILDDAELNHRNRCHEKIAEADALQNGPFRVCIVEVHRKCALYLQATGDIKELPDWVSRRAKLNTTDECEFCGFENRRGSPVCKNCREVLDQAKYDELKAKRKKKAS